MLGCIIILVLILFLLVLAFPNHLPSHFYWKFFDKKKYNLFILAKSFFESNKNHNLFRHSSKVSAVNFVKNWGIEGIESWFPESLRIKEIRKQKLNKIEHNNRYR